MKIDIRLGIFASALLIAAAGVAQETPEGTVKEGDLQLKHGEVNWTDRTITATGSGAPDLKANNVAVARLGAERVAKLDALRNILETLKGVRIQSDVTVKNEMVTSETMRTKIEGIAKNFKVLHMKYYSDGGVDVTVQMSLDGQLTSSVVKGAGSKAADVQNQGAAKNSGLIVDTRGLKAMPALAPRILDESGKVVYSSEFVEPASLESNGVAAYFKDPETAKKAKRTGDSPLALRALRLGETKTDVVISNADAEKLREAGTNLGYLKEGRVAFVVD